jgi:cytochrome P450
MKPHKVETGDEFVSKWWGHLVTDGAWAEMAADIEAIVAVRTAALSQPARGDVVERALSELTKHVAVHGMDELVKDGDRIVGWKKSEKLMRLVDAAYNAMPPEETRTTARAIAALAALGAGR